MAESKQDENCESGSSKNPPILILANDTFGSSDWIAKRFGESRHNWEVRVVPDADTHRAAAQICKHYKEPLEGRFILHVQDVHYPQSGSGDPLLGLRDILPEVCAATGGHPPWTHLLVTSILLAGKGTEQERDELKKLLDSKVFPEDHRFPNPVDQQSTMIVAEAEKHFDAWRKNPNAQCPCRVPWCVE